MVLKSSPPIYSFYTNMVSWPTYNFKNPLCCNRRAHGLLKALSLPEALASLRNTSLTQFTNMPKTIPHRAGGETGGARQTG